MMERLIGKTITKIEVNLFENGEVIFHTSDGGKYKLHHPQECCEYVTLKEISGYFYDLIGMPVLRAYESNNFGDVPDDEVLTFTWSFYTIVTNRGTVVISFYGTSKGSGYSETAVLEDITNKEN